MANQITDGNASRQAILRGVNSLPNAVKVTLGPRGRNVILDKKFGSPTLGAVGVMDACEQDGHSQPGGAKCRVRPRDRPGFAIGRAVIHGL
jgi:hypothetical protein